MANNVVDLFSANMMMLLGATQMFDGTNCHTVGTDALWSWTKRVFAFSWSQSRDRNTIVVVTDSK
jgi:hypothetical protein